MIRKPYLEVAHFSVEKPAQFRVETNKEALGWLAEQTALLLELVNTVCSEHLAMLERNGR
ncbi:hypothetical protein AOG23_29405 [Rhizobium acidisoli]|nr:hypothetical protein AOG23_29405 [Rhizobium acidisoli]